MEKNTLHKLINITGLNEQAINNAYLFGSRVYGNYRDDSDYDYIVVGRNLSYREVTSGDINIHVMSEHLFRSNLEDYDMRAIECILAPESMKTEKTRFKFKIDKRAFVDKIYFQVDKNWRVAKRKFNESDTYGGKKRIYHSLRILMFAQQLLKKNNITDWTVANQVHAQLMQDSHTDWEWYRDMWTAQKTMLERKLNKC